MIKILILGSLEEGSNYSEFSNLLSLNISQQEVLLFCDYSEYNIPIGQEFNILKDRFEKDVFRGRVILKGVTQQFKILFDEIPYGWQTLSKFEIVEGDFSGFKRIIGKTKNWEYKIQTYSLIS
jgi:hypothetical protein